MSEMNLLTSMAFGTVNRLAGDNRSLSNTLDQANENMNKAQGIINRQHAQIQQKDSLALQQNARIQEQNAELRLQGAQIKQNHARIQEKNVEIRLQNTQIGILKFELKRMTALREADAVAKEAETDAWREEHLFSDMHNVLGRLKDGKPLYRNTKIWNDAFDAACAVRNIVSPEAWRQT